MVGGVPAKIIKYRYSQEMINRLLEIEWWNLPDAEISKVIDLFHTPNPSVDDINKYFNRGGVKLYSPIRCESSCSGRRLAA